jgi:hypothetical protein
VFERVATGARTVALDVTHESGAARSVRLRPPYGDVGVPAGSAQELQRAVESEVRTVLVGRQSMSIGDLRALLARGCETKDRIETARAIGEAPTWEDAADLVIGQLGGAGVARQEIIGMAADLDREQSASNLGKLAVYGICTWAR